MCENWLKSVVINHWLDTTLELWLTLELTLEITNQDLEF